MPVWRAYKPKTKTRANAQLSWLVGADEEVVMGASGVNIFDDDVACDARAAMIEQFRAGLSVKASTDAVLEDLADCLEDVEDQPTSRGEWKQWIKRSLLCR